MNNLSGIQSNRGFHEIAEFEKNPLYKVCKKIVKIKFMSIPTENIIKSKEQILQAVQKLLLAHKQGLLGGEKMPEDSKPNLPLDSEENLLYLTLPMALNYQRNSYKLWESALVTWQDEQTKFVFDPQKVSQFSSIETKNALLEYKIPLLSNKQPEIWSKICHTICTKYNSKLLNLLEKNNFALDQILVEIQQTNKKDFPYLSVNKIANYWLYVLTQYTSFPFQNKHKLSIAPDTHIQQASIKLGLSSSQDSPLEVAQRWQNLLKNSDISPIDVHTPFWLWSRSGFKFEV